MNRPAATLFEHGGAIGKVLRETRWDDTTLGPLDAWPSVLITTLNLMLSARQPMTLCWGPEHLFFCNDACFPMVGQARFQSAVGRPTPAHWPEQWKHVAVDVLSVLQGKPGTWHQNQRIPIERDGELRDAYWSYGFSAVRDERGVIVGALNVFNETTEAVLSVRRMEDEQRSALMQMPFPVAVLSGPDLVYTLINPLYCALIGGRHPLGMSVYAAFPELAGAPLEPMRQVMASGEAFVVDAYKVAFDRYADGRVEDCYFQMLLHPLRNLQDEVHSVMIVAIDVTSFIATRERIEAAMAEKQALVVELEEADRAKDAFLATVSHELRTPLTSIVGWSRLLLNTQDPERLKKGLAVIERNATTQTRLVEDMLDVSRIIAGKLRMSMGWVDVPAVIATALGTVRPQATAKGVQLTVEIDPGLRWIVADEERLQQILWNLLTNAVKFTPRGGSVSLHAHGHGDTATFRIEDTGDGIAPELLPFVFERFRQGDSSSTKPHAGLGLGLSIVRHLVELHGGTVSAHSNGLGHGACIQVNIPAHSNESKIDPADAARNGARPLRNGHDALRDLHVLVVEDEDDTRDYISSVLNDAGAQVTQVNTAPQALHVLAESTIHVLVSDIGMPQQDGYALIEQMRASNQPWRVRGIPALALTAFTKPEDRRRAIATGFQDHVAKPIDPRVLVDRIAALAER